MPWRVLALALALALTPPASAQVLEPDPPTLTACTLSAAAEVPEFLLSQRVHVGWTSTNLYSPSNVRVSLEAADDGTEAAVLHETLPNTGVLEWTPELTGGLPAIGVNGSVEFVLRIRSLEDARGEDTTQRFRLYNGTAIAYEKSVENCRRTRTEAECEDPATLDFPFEYPFGGRNVPADANNNGISLPLFSQGLPLSTTVNSYRHLSVYDAFLLGLNDGSRLLRSVGIVALNSPSGPLDNFRIGTASTDRVNITRSALLGDPDAFLTAAQYERDSVAPGDVTVLDWQDYDLAAPLVLPARGSLLLEFSSVSDRNLGLFSPFDTAWLSGHPDVPVSAAMHNENVDSWANQEYPYEQPLSTTLFEYLPYLRVRMEDLREGGVQGRDTLQCGARPKLQSRSTDFAWSRIDSERPSPRVGVSMTSYKDEGGRKYVVLYGGTSYEPAGPVFHGDLWLYTVSEQRWQQYKPAREDADACWDAVTLGSSVNLLKVNRPDCAADHTATMINGEQMVLFGGRNARGVIDSGGFGHAFVLNVASFVRCMRGDVACGRVWLDTEKRTDRARLAQFGVQCGTPRSFGCGSVASQFEPAGLYDDNTAPCCPIVADLTTNARGEVRPTYGHSAASDGNGTLWLYGGVGKNTDGDETRTDQLVRMSFAPWYIDNNSSRPFVNDTILEGTNIYSSDARWELLAGSGDLDSASCGDTASGRCVSYATMEHTAAGLAGDGATLVLFGGEHGAEPSTRERTNRMLGLAAADGTETVLQAEDCDVATAGLRPSCRAHHTSGARGGVLLHYGGTADILDLEGEQAPGPTNNLWSLSFDATRAPVWEPQSFEECRQTDSTFTATQCAGDTRMSVVDNTLFLFGGAVPVESGLAYTDDFWATRLRPFVGLPVGGAVATLPTEGGPAGSRRLTVSAINVFPPNLNAADFDNSTVRVLVVRPWETNTQSALDAASVCELHSVAFGVDTETGLTDGRSSLECDAPAGVGANMSLAVFVNDTGLWYSDPVPFFSFEPPRVDSVSIDGDAAPSTAGGAVLTLRGENLGAAGAETVMAVSAGPYACEVLAASSAEVTCRLAGGSGGGHLVTLTAGLGDEGAQSSDAPAGSEVSYAVPSVTRINSANAVGLVAAGEAFTVHGNNFGLPGDEHAGAAEVCFGGEPARECVAAAVGRDASGSGAVVLTGHFPNWSGAGQGVTARVSGLESNASDGPSVSYAAPQVVQISVDFDSALNGGAEAAVYGRHFGKPGADGVPVSVLFGGVPCQAAAVEPPEVPPGGTEALEKITCLVTRLPGNSSGAAVAVVGVNGQRSARFEVTGALLCPAGSSIRQNGTCTECPRNGFQGEAQARFCESCPAGFRKRGAGRANTSDCVPCPVQGALCSPGRPAVAPPGHWLAVDEATGALEVFPCEPGRCLAATECFGGSAAETDAGLAAWPDGHFSCCASGREPAAANPMCGRCADGRSEWGGECVECGDGGKLLLLPYAAFLLLALVALQAVSRRASGAATVKILVVFVQTVHTFYATEASSPITTAGAVLASSALELTGSCVVPVNDLTKAVLPAIQALAVYALLLVVFLLNATDWAARRRLARLHLREAPRFATAHFLRVLLAVLLFSLIPVLRVAARLTRCVSVGGVSVLRQYPAVECSGLEYTAWLLTSWLMAAVLLGGGVAVVLLGQRGYRELVAGAAGGEGDGAARARHARLAARYGHTMGFLFSLYRGEDAASASWEAVALVRSTVLVACAALVDDWQSRFALLSGVAALFLSLHASVRPYRRGVDNATESGALLVLVLIGSVNSSQWHDDTVARVVAAVLFFGLVAAAAGEAARRRFARARAAAAKPKPGPAAVDDPEPDREGRDAAGKGLCGSLRRLFCWYDTRGSAPRGGAGAGRPARERKPSIDWIMGEPGSSSSALELAVAERAERDE